MNKELKYIFVPNEVSILASEKGFKEWSFPIKKILPLFGFHFENEADEPKGNMITHTQLIMWLVEQHHIEIQLQMNGMFTVCDAFGTTLWINDENEFEINDAITHALNLLPNDKV